MTRVFISYSRKDKPFTAKFTGTLNKSDLETWIDWEDIPATADWLDQIHTGIEQSDGFLFLLSPDSIASDICRREVDHAVQNAKRLIPIVVRDVDANKVHPALAKVNWIYCREQDDFDSAIEKTSKAIRTDLAWVEFHRRLQVRALEWEKRRDSSFLLRGRDLREAEEQLVLVGQKDPWPTDLQRQYTLSSRRGESRTRNRILVIGAVILAALFILSVFANNQRILAQNNEGTAIANAQVASTEKVNAENQQATAVANADLALARQLAAQSQLLVAESGPGMVQSGLLAVESLRRYPTIEGDQVLKRNFLLFPQPISSMHHNGDLQNDVWKIAFSPDGKFLVSGSSDKTARVWNTTTGNEISYIQHDDTVVNVAFSPDGRSVVSSGGSSIYVWEAINGSKIHTLLHDGTVNSVEFSADGKTIISGSSDGTARVWNAVTGQAISQIKHDGIVWDVALSKDGKYAVSGGNDNARVWDAATGTEVAQMNPAGRVFSVVFSPDGKYVASAGEDMSRVWESDTGEEISHIKQAGNILKIAFSPDWRSVASGSTDGTLLVWDAGTGNEIARSAHDWIGTNDPVMGAINALEFSPDGKFILTGSIDGTGRIWEAQTGTEIVRLAADEYYGAEDVVNGFVNTVVFSPDGKHAAIGNNNGLIRIWKIDTDMELKLMDIGYNTTSNNIALSPDGSKIAYGDDDLHIWDLLMDSETVRTFPSGDIIWMVGFNSDGKRVFSTGLNNMAKIWDAATGQKISAIKYQDIIAFSSTGDWAVSREEDDTVRIWNTGTGNEINRITIGNQISSLAISLDGKRIATGSANAASIWEVATGREVLQIGTSDFGTQVAFSPDGKWIVDSTVRILESASGKEVARVNHNNPVYSVAFSSDSRYMASGSAELVPLGATHGTMIIWDTVTQKETAHISYDSDIYSVVFSPDGKWITSYGTSNIARIFNVSTGMEIGRITHEAYGYINGLSFSPDGKLIFTRGTDGLLKMWLWRPEDMISDLCNRLPRNLTRTEWNFYIGNEPYRATCTNLPLELELPPTPSP
jgi:WD40 repeat protein